MTHNTGSLFSGHKSSVISHQLVIYTDGGSRGNPGPAAIGYVIMNVELSGSTSFLAERGEYIGETTNNIAEYKAIAAALKKAKVLLGKKTAKQREVEVRMDSELACRQLSGKYRIENEGLQPLFFEIWNSRFDFKSVTFVHVPRSHNAKADAMVNQALDENFKKW